MHILLLDGPMLPRFDTFWRLYPSSLFIHGYTDQYSRLNIPCNDPYFDILITFLTHIPRVRSLSLDEMSSLVTPVLLAKYTNNSDLVYDNNVTDVTITYALTPDGARMECLQICQTNSTLK